MFSREKIAFPVLSGDWKTDGPALVAALQRYTLALDKLGIVAIEQASIDRTPIGQNTGGAAAGKFTTLEVTASSVFPTAAWTPTGNGVTFTTATGKYFKFGGMVVAFFQAVWPVTADGGAARIGGLPVAASASGDSQGGFISFTNAGVTYSFAVTLSQTYGQLFTNAGVAATNANVSGKTFVGAAVYYT